MDGALLSESKYESLEREKEGYAKFVYTLASQNFWPISKRKIVVYMIMKFMIS